MLRPGPVHGSLGTTSSIHQQQNPGGVSPCFGLPLLPWLKAEAVTILGAVSLRKESQSGTLANGTLLRAEDMSNGEGRAAFP